jgi:hypothetical protein
LVLAPQLAFAWPPIFGPEWEFTREALYDRAPALLPWSEGLERAQFKLINKIFELCPECKGRSEVNKYGFERYRITFPQLEGWWILVDIDPGVIEVTAKPLSLEKYAQFAPEIQRLVFDAAKSVNIFPDFRANAHQFHMSLKDTFDDDALLFRNFLVDFVNHSELSSGILESDFGNAAPLAALLREKQLAFGEIIRRFDEEGNWSIKKLAGEIYSDVQDVTFDGSSSPEQKYQDINITRVAESGWRSGERTVEMRAVHGQPTIYGFARVLELFQARLFYLKKLGDQGVRVAYEGPRSKKMTRAEAEASFRRYVTEAGLDWGTFKTAMMKTPKREAGARYEIGEAAAAAEAARIDAAADAVSEAKGKGAKGISAKELQKLVSSIPEFKSLAEMDTYYGGEVHPRQTAHTVLERLVAEAAGRSILSPVSPCRQSLAAKAKGVSSLLEP